VEALDHPAEPPKSQVEALDHPAEPPKSQVEALDHPAEPPKSQVEALDHPAEPPKSQVEAPKSQADARDPRAEARKRRAEARKRRGEAYKRRDEAYKRRDEAHKHQAKVLAPWAKEHRHWAKARKLPGEPYRDIYTCIYSDEVDEDAANDDSDVDKIADRAKYDMHSGQMFCVTRWACPDCRHHCLLIELNILHESSLELIQLYKDQLKTHLIKNSRYRLN
jgi:hypothetical protein